MLKCTLSMAVFAIFALVCQDKDLDDLFTAGGHPKTKSDLFAEKNTLLDGVPERYHFLYKFLPEKNDTDAANRELLPYSEIRLTRSTCLGPCPAYDVTISSNGLATYHGIQFADRNGKHKAKIHLSRFARMCWAIDRLDLTKDKRQANWVTTDTPNTTITVTKKTGENIQISDFGSRSTIELSMVAALFDQITSDLKWKPEPK